MSPDASVSHIRLDGGSLSATECEITVTRGHRLGSPLASDVPADIRRALRAWLDTSQVTEEAHR